MSRYLNPTPGARAVGMPMVGQYHCPELRPFQGRPSATQATALPSRRGNRLHHPCGLVTDLAGQPLNPPVKESA